MWIRYAIVLSLCLFGFACEKKDDGNGASSSEDGKAKITVNEGGKSQPGKATVKDAASGQQTGVLSTPGDDDK